MSELSKQALKVDNNQSFPNNNGGLITPSILRAFNENMIDSMVDEIPYGEYTQSIDISINALNQFTASAQSLSTGSLLITASANLNNITFTKGDSSQFTITVDTGSTVSTDLTSLNEFTASQNTKNATLSTYTSSIDTKFSTLGTQSGSWITESETGSFARYDVSNPWSANQTFTNISAVSASFQYVQTTYETSSVIYSSGSNIFGDSILDIQTLNGQTKVSGSLGVTGSFYNNGLVYPTTDGTAGQIITTNGAGDLSFIDISATNITTITEAVRYGENITIGDPLYVSGSNGTRPIVFKADAADTNKMPVIYVASSTGTTNTNTTAIALGLITGVTTTGYPDGTLIYVGEGGGWSAIRPSGSTSIVQPLGIVTKEGSGGSGRGLVLNPGPVLLPNIQTGYAWVGNGGNQPVAVATSSFGTPINTGSFATTGSNIFTGDQYVTNGVLQVATYPQTSKQWFSPTAIEAIGTSSVAYEQFVDGGGYDAFNVVTTLDNGTEFRDLPSDTFVLNTWLSIPRNTGNNPAPQFKRGLTVTGSTNIQSFTASLQEGHVFVGNASGRTITVSTSSFAGGTINTGSFATTGSNTFVGNQTISGSNKIGFGTTPNDVYINSPLNGVLYDDLDIINYSSTGKTKILANNGVNINGVNSDVNITGKTGVNVYGDTSISGAMNITGSLTASLQQGYVWVGDVSGKTSLVSTSSFAGETINTGSFATTGSNTFVALQSINFSGTGTTLASSIVGNSTQVETDMYVDGGNYDTFNVFVSASNGIQLRDYSITLNSVKPFISVATDAGELTLHRNTNISGNLDIQSTLTASLEQGYVWVGNASGKTTTVATSSFGGGGAFPYTGTASISGSLQVTGSMSGLPNELTVSSNTASIDFTKGNFFSITLPASATTHFTVANTIKGQTINVQINQPTGASTGSVSFSPTILFAGGNDYQATATGSAIDLLTMVSITGSSVLATSIKNFL